MLPGGGKPRRIDAIVFDFGGVLVDIDFARAFACWADAAGASARSIGERWGMDEAYCRHERGEIGVRDYFEALRGSLGLALDDEQFAHGWNSIFLGEVPGIAKVLRELDGRVPLYVFSNSNAAHRAFWQERYAETLRPFDRIFVSSDLGKRKPAPEAFHAVCQAIDVPPERVLFFDDTAANVAGALAIGMAAVHVASVRDVERALEAHGFA